MSYVEKLKNVPFAAEVCGGCGSIVAKSEWDRHVEFHSLIERISENAAKGRQAYTRTNTYG